MISKEIDIVPDKYYYKVQFTTGGELPVVLSGGFTSRGAAQKAIDVYLANKNTEKREYRKSKTTVTVENVES